MRAGRGAGSLFHERVVIRFRRKAIAEPLQAQPGALRHSHDMPFAAHGVAERVHASCGVVRHVLHVREDHAGGAERTGHDPRLDDAEAEMAAEISLDS